VHVAKTQVYLRIFDLQNHRRGARGYLLPAACGYATGLLLTYAALYFSLFGDQARRPPRLLCRCSALHMFDAANALSFLASVNTYVISATEVDTRPPRVEHKQVAHVVWSSIAPHGPGIDRSDAACRGSRRSCTWYRARLA